jgi:hypothetical protein
MRGEVSFKLIVKKHVSAGRLILAACDDSLIGSVIEDSDAVIDLGRGFYQGEETAKEEFLSLIKKAYILNAVGPDTIKVLLEEGIISQDNIKKVNDVPHVQLVFEGN